MVRPAAAQQRHNAYRRAVPSPAPRTYWILGRMQPLGELDYPSQGDWERGWVTWRRHARPEHNETVHKKVRFGLRQSGVQRAACRV